MHEIPWSHKSYWGVIVSPIFRDGNRVKPSGFAVDRIREGLGCIKDRLIRPMVTKEPGGSKAGRFQESPC